MDLHRSQERPLSFPGPQVTAARTIGMEPPAALALLGKAVAVRIGRGPEIDLGNSRFVAADPAGGALYIGPDSSARAVTRPTPDHAKAAERLRREFAGQLDGASWSLHGFPRRWSALGPARTIVYRSDKTNGGGTGRAEDFAHEFSPGAVAYSGGDYIMILGDKIRVDASGVRN